MPWNEGHVLLRLQEKDGYIREHVIQKAVLAGQGGALEQNVLWSWMLFNNLLHKLQTMVKVVLEQLAP